MLSTTGKTWRTPTSAVQADDLVQAQFGGTKVVADIHVAVGARVLVRRARQKVLVAGGGEAVAGDLGLRLAAVFGAAFDQRLAALDQAETLERRHLQGVARTGAPFFGRHVDRPVALGQAQVAAFFEVALHRLGHVGLVQGLLVVAAGGQQQQRCAAQE
jgi:hypothetical protein